MATEPFIVVVRGPEDMKAAEFAAKYTEEISKYIMKKEVQFWVTDQKGVALYTVRMLEKRQFQNCKIFHTGDKCRHNIGKNFTRIGEYPTMAAIEADFLVSADAIIGEN